MIANTCGTCGKAIETPADQRGQQRKCPACGDAFIVGMDAPADDSDAYGVAGTPAATAASAPRRKPASKPADKTKAAPNPALTPGKVECPTCHEVTAADRPQCGYCGDVLTR